MDPLQDTKTQDEEMAELKAALDDAQTQLHEEAKLIDKLTRENQAKSEALILLETSMTSEMETQRVLRQVQTDEWTMLQNEDSHTITVLKSKNNNLNLHLEAYTVLEESNISLRKRVDELIKELEKEGRTHADEIHKMRKDMFNHKMALEQTFRTTLQGMDSDYLAKAFEEMSIESKEALTANAKLKEELFIQSNGVENLMRRFKAQGEMFHKLKVENEILEKGSSLHIKEIAILKRKQHEYSLRLSETQSSNSLSNSEKDRQYKKRIQQLEKNVLNNMDLLEKSQSRASQWKSRAMELAVGQKPQGGLGDSRNEISKDLYSDIGQGHSIIHSAKDNGDCSGKNKDIWCASSQSGFIPSPASIVALAVRQSSSLSHSFSTPSFSKIPHSFHKTKIEMPLKLPSAVGSKKGYSGKKMKLRMNGGAVF